MRIDLPDPCTVVLIGASSSGKSTFAQSHFAPSSVLSSDAFRAMVCDDENSLTVNQDAFDSLHFVLGRRLQNMRLTVVDATNVQPDSRAQLVHLTRAKHLFPVAIVFDTPESVCLSRNADRADRTIPESAIRRHVGAVRQANARRLEREGFKSVFVVRPDDEVEIVRRPLFPNRVDERGPFDVIGDVHGCYEELVELLGALGYAVGDDCSVTCPPGRRLIFVGDLVDRGPRTPDVLRLVMHAVSDGKAFCVPGNHDVKLVRALRGAKVRIAHGLQASLDQLESTDESFKRDVMRFLDGLVSHLVLDGGDLVVAHAGMTSELVGRASGRVRSFALYGDTTGESDEYGLPVRLNWAANYRGDATIVYGHTPTLEPEWVNRTVCIDTGCVFGGSLTALRWPERTFVAVPARHVYSPPVRPLASATQRSGQHAADDVLDLADVTGRRRIETRFGRAITIDAQHNAAALEVMSRFAIDPRWLVYLPPTMSPTETSSVDGYLERPEEVFAFYAAQSIEQVVCEQKHMGSRAVLTVARDEDAAMQRFGVAMPGSGVIATRTGRPFFRDQETSIVVLNRVRAALDGADLWRELDADWVCLDAEIMPWSLKAKELLSAQYAAVGAAATEALARVGECVQAAADRGVDVSAFAARIASHAANTEAFRQAYRGYCWDVHAVDDIRVAPFMVLAAGSSVLFDRPHRWHLEVIDRLVEHDAMLVRTDRRFVNVTDAAQVADAVAWWEAETLRGAEGMVVKPHTPITQTPRGPAQAGVKVRGLDYLRIIYGPDYTDPQNLSRLRKRGLGRKRSLAAREFALGVEALERFVRREPLRRVHECVFGVLALESEPVDPRL